MILLLTDLPPLPVSVDSFHIPAVLSLPHFYLAADKYREAVMGMHPNKEEHQTIIDAEPVYCYITNYNRCRTGILLGHKL